MKNKKLVGKALGRVPSGLFVITAKFEDKEDAVLASWVSQCSFDPPALTIALGTLRSARLLIEASGAFIVNVLPKDDKTLLKHFSQPREDSFKGVKSCHSFMVYLSLIDKLHLAHMGFKLNISNVPPLLSGISCPT